MYQCVFVVEVVAGSSFDMVVVIVCSISALLVRIIDWLLVLVESPELAKAIASAKMTTKVMIVAKERPIYTGLLGMF